MKPNCVPNELTIHLAHLIKIIHSKKLIIPYSLPPSRSLRFASGQFFDALRRELHESRADALRLLIRMGDPNDGFDGLGVILDFLHERILHCLGQFAVERGRRFCKFQQNPRGLRW